jgi:CubicO group peptidase (beta-lactamase class C family)
MWRLVVDYTSLYGLHRFVEMEGVLGFVGVSAGHLLYNYYQQHLVRSKAQCVLDTWVQGGLLPCGQLIVFKDEKEIFYGSSGCGDHEKKKPLQRNSIFRIYSMTKPVTIVGALMLMERGLLSLDDPVWKYIPSFQNMTVFVGGDEHNPITEPTHKDVTIKDLMMHTAGITYGIFPASHVDKILTTKIEDAKNWFTNTPLKELCDILGTVPLVFQPGTKWLYGLNTDVLGRVIEVVSGQPLDVFFQNQIFTPLGMIDTGFYVPQEKLSRLVDCFEFTGATVPTGFRLSTHPERDRSKQPTLLSGGGGLVSTIDDYSKFVRCLQRGGSYSPRHGCFPCAILSTIFSSNSKSLLRPETIQLMYQNHLPGEKDIKDLEVGAFSESIGAGVGFGLGVSVVSNPRIVNGGSLSGKGEYGWGGVASTWFTIDPVKNISAVFYTQVIPSTKSLVRSQLRWLCHAIAEESK